jgi:type IV secretion system protein VirB6
MLMTFRKILLVAVQLVLFISANSARADTFGESCSALPLFDTTDYLVEDTAYGYLRNNIDMKTYALDACEKGGSEFKFCIRNATGSPAFCSPVTMNIGDQRALSSLNANPAIGQDPALKDIVLEVKAIGNDICLLMPTSRGMIPLMCRNGTEDEVVPPGEAEVCKNLGQSCYDGRTKSQSLLSFSGLTIHCLRDTLNKVFYVGDECPRHEEDLAFSMLQPFPIFQETMKTAVRAALILYVLIYGFNLAMNGEYAHVDKVAMFIIKFVLVTYFAVGLGGSSSGTGAQVSQNGMTGFALPILVEMTTNFTEMVFLAGGAHNLCNFDVNRYASGYEFYKVWDAIDCRIGYYLGMQVLYDIGSVLTSVSGTLAGGNVGNEINYGPGTADAADALSDVGSFSFFVVLFGMFMAGQIIFVIMGVLFAVFLISVLAYFLTSYLVCMVTLYVMAYISPIFITMALFERTKSYFDSWLKIVISCTLQPAVVGGFIAILLTVYDSAIYGNCEFQRHDYSISEINFSTFELREPTVEIEKCHESLGFKLMKYYSGHGWEKKKVMLFEILKIEDYLNMTLSLIYVMMYVFIFYYFVKSVGQFASDITGGPNMDSAAISPTALIDKGLATAAAANTLAQSVLKAGVGDIKGAWKDAKGSVKKAKEDTASNQGATDKMSTDGDEGSGIGSDDTIPKEATSGDTISTGSSGGDK